MHTQTTHDCSAERQAEIDAILVGLRPLIARARATACWLYFPHGDAWFSPRELEVEIDRGAMIFSAENWQLHPPEERLDELRQAATDASLRATAFGMRLRKERTLASATATVEEREC